MTKSEAAKLVAMLSTAYADAKWTEATCATYEAMLLDLDAELATKAIRRLIQTAKFRPAISEIREAAASVELGDKRSGMEAWGDVLQAIRAVGGYSSPRFDDPLVATAVERMGWKNLCWGDASDASDRARFVELYDALAARRQRNFVIDPNSNKQLPEAQADLVKKIAGIGKGAV
jgi:hypothetical protein